MQAKVLVNIVKGDPYLTSHLNSELARLNDKMDSIIHSMEHMKDRTLRTEERVNNIEARLEQLEVRRVARKSRQKLVHIFLSLIHCATLFMIAKKHCLSH